MRTELDWCSQHSNYSSGWKIHRSIPGRSKDLSFLQKHPDRVWGIRNFLFNEYQDSFAGTKRPGREVYQSPQSSIHVKNERNWTFTPPMCLYSVDRSNFNFNWDEEGTSRNKFLSWYRPLQKHQGTDISKRNSPTMWSTDAMKARIQVFVHSC